MALNRILLIHTFYQQAGGEDQVFRAEADLLAAKGHDVLQYTKHNSALEGLGQLKLAQTTLWNQASYNELRQLIQKSRPDVIHIHNTFPLLSPSVYHAAKAEGIATVQTLHNFRITCLNSLLLRNDQPCEDCLGKPIAWPGIQHACYRGSRAASAVVAGMQSYHRLRGTWQHKIDRYIALTDFARNKFIEIGLPEAKVVVKPNFARDPLGHIDSNQPKGFALFVGRLSAEKGISTLLQAWSGVENLELKVVGDGPLASEVVQAAQTNPRITFLGQIPHLQVLELMQSARFLLLPSICYENFPMTLVEAYSCGLPVVGSNLGAMAALIKPGKTGLLFRPGDPNDLAHQVNHLNNNAPLLAYMQKTARLEYQEKYTPEQNYLQLLDIYQQVQAQSSVKGTLPR